MTDYKLVPVEPTPEMIDAGRSQSSFPLGVYKAMLAAVPAVQGEPVAYILDNDVYFEGVGGDVNDHIRSYGQPLYAAPQPAEQPEPDVAGLVEALEDIGAPWHRAGTRLEKYLQARARNALDARRKGGEK